MHTPQKRILGQVEDMLRNSLDSLSDEDFQRRIWFRDEGPEVSSYSESVEHFIGNCESIFRHSVSEEYLGKENFTLIKHLYDLILEHYDSVWDRIDPDLLEENELLDDPNWHDIQQYAEELEKKLIEFCR